MLAAGIEGGARPSMILSESDLSSTAISLELSFQLG